MDRRKLSCGKQNNTVLFIKVVGALNVLNSVLGGFVIEIAFRYLLSKALLRSDRAFLKDVSSQ